MGDEAILRMLLGESFLFTFNHHISCYIAPEERSQGDKVETKSIVLIARYCSACSFKCWSPQTFLCRSCTTCQHFSSEVVEHNYLEDFIEWSDASSSRCFYVDVISLNASSALLQGLKFKHQAEISLDEIALKLNNGRLFRSRVFLPFSVKLTNLKLKSVNKLRSFDWS